MDPQQGFHLPRVPAWPLNTRLGSSPLTSHKRMPFATPETEDPPLVDDPCWLSKIRKFRLPFSIWLTVSWCSCVLPSSQIMRLHISFSLKLRTLPGDFQEPMAFLFAAEKLQQDEYLFFVALDAESTSIGIDFLPGMIHENDDSSDHKLQLWKKSFIVVQVRTWKIEVATGIWWYGSIMVV